jgi:iron complex transport system ATP-binding protein
MAQSA